MAHLRGWKTPFDIIWMFTTPPATTIPLPQVWMSTFPSARSDRPVLNRLDRNLKNPIELNRSEFKDLVAFVRDGTPGQTGQLKDNLCKLVPLIGAERLAGPSVPGLSVVTPRPFLLHPPENASIEGSPHPRPAKPAC